MSLPAASLTQRVPRPRVARPAPRVVTEEEVVVVPPARRRRGRRRRNGRAPGLQAQLNALDSGTMAPQSSLRTKLQGVIADKVDLSEDALGWYYKYHDPAGAVETHRAHGEFSKIPDGTTKFSVDAETRPVDDVFCPNIATSNLPLDGATWSVIFVSLPSLRANFIAIANTTNQDLGATNATALLNWLNNLPDWRTVVDDKVWSQFDPDDDTWFVRIFVHPPTYSAPDSSEGILRTIQSYRLTYKSVTFGFNAPDLVNQGWWVGGHFAPSPNVISSGDSDATDEAALFAVQRTATNTYNCFFVWVNVEQGGTAPDGSPAWVSNGNDESYLSWRHGGNSPPAGSVSYTWPYEQSVYSFSAVGDRVLFADFGDVITFTQTGAVPTTWLITLVNTTNDSVDPVVVTMNTGSTLAQQQFVIAGRTESVHNRLRFELPGLTFDEIAANNPKMEQHQLSTSRGAYLVHSKMRNPVFELTPASSFGAFQFTYPSAVGVVNRDAFVGIRDSFDINMSTGVVVMKGVSQSATIVAKTYMGWEGVPGSHTTLGQFAHSGQEPADELMCLANRLAGTHLTGVYPATDNFAGAVATLAAGALSSVLKSQATNSTIQQVAKTAVDYGNQVMSGDMTGVAGLISGLTGRVFQRIRARRLKRRQQAAL